MSGSGLLGQFMYVWNLYAWYIGELLNTQNSIRDFNLPVDFLIIYLATLMHTSVFSHLVFSDQVNMINEG